MGTCRRNFNADGDIDSGILYQSESAGQSGYVASYYGCPVFVLLVVRQTIEPSPIAVIARGTGRREAGGARRAIQVVIIERQEHSHSDSAMQRRKKCC